MASAPPPPRQRSRLPAPDPRLLQAIRDPNIRIPASGLVQHALEALGDLHRLDESLYERFMEGGGRVADDAAPDALLRRLQTVTFRGLRSLLVYSSRVRPKDAQVEAQPESMSDFDFGGLDDSPSAELAAAEQALDFKDSDIGDLLEIIDEHEVAGESERWTTMLEKVSSIEYGLRSQLRDLEERLETSLGARQVGQALEALDDTRSSTSEGIFAMLSAVYEAFLPEVDPATVAPGHLTSLGRALLVRRGLTDLVRAVSPRNDVLQSDKATPDKKQRALEKLRATMATFIGGDVFRAMRPADRWELTKFERTLREESGPAAYMIAEGLAKYLESLGSVNRREVLIAHDERALEELRESLSAARPLLEINQGVAADLVRRAYNAALSLYGRNPANDDLIIALRDAQPQLDNRSEIEATAGTLELLLAEEPH
ncbi:MAG: hypothetical protein HYV09_31990 [Deltaproteobacteria bacterium]|nr:hypothetical protein [Deltaproteobacteria bacterium]